MKLPDRIIATVEIINDLQRSGVPFDLLIRPGVLITVGPPDIAGPELLSPVPGDGVTVVQRIPS